MVDVETHGLRLRAGCASRRTEGVRTDLDARRTCSVRRLLRGVAVRRARRPLAARADRPQAPDGRQADVVTPRRRTRRSCAPGTEQVVTVDHTDGYRARVTFWQLTDGGWQARLDADRRPDRVRRPGARHRRRKQGTGTTPLGTYGLLVGLRHPRRRPALATLPLPRGSASRRLLGAGQRVGATTTATATRREGGFRWWLPASDPNTSERLTDFPTSTSRDRHRLQRASRCGTAARGIFLHVNGARRDRRLRERAAPVHATR